MKDLGHTSYRIIFDYVAFSVLKSALLISVFYSILWIIASPSEAAFLMSFLLLFGSLFAPILVFPAIFAVTFLYKGYLSKNIRNVSRWVLGSLGVGLIYSICFLMIVPFLGDKIFLYSIPVSLLTGYLSWKQFAIPSGEFLPGTE